MERKAKCVDRRKFLVGLGSGALAAAFANSGCLHSDNYIDDKLWKMKLSTSTIHFKTLPFKQACKKIAELGFEAIDIWPSNFGCPHLDEVQNHLGIDGLKNVLNQYNLKFYAVSLYSLDFAYAPEFFHHIYSIKSIQSTIASWAR